MKNTTPHDKRIDDAPEPIRAELQRLHKAGILQNPEVRKAFVEAAAALKEEHATGQKSRSE